MLALTTEPLFALFPGLPCLVGVSYSQAQGRKHTSPVSIVNEQKQLYSFLKGRERPLAKKEGNGSASFSAFPLPSRQHVFFHFLDGFIVLLL